VVPTFFEEVPTNMSSPKVDLAISLVQNLIRSGEIKPGDRLPNETEFSAQLGVSRNSLREAVRAMSAMKILEARQGDGTYVSGLDPTQMIETLRFAVDVSGPEAVLWFLEIRILMELHTTAIAAARRTKADLDRLKDTDTLLKKDSEFHHIIAETTKNPIMASLLNVVSAPALRARIWRNRLTESATNNLRIEHEAVLNCIEAQDVEGAKYAMYAHVSGVQSWVRNNPDFFSKNGGDDKADTAPDSAQ
jgi:GntR family transcriptional repressor for pyruvate dehydrogenase complex